MKYFCEFFKLSNLVIFSSNFTKKTLPILLIRQFSSEILKDIQIDDTHIALMELFKDIYSFPTERTFSKIYFYLLFFFTSTNQVMKMTMSKGPGK